ncbi:MAG: adenylate/guanylate cyclase domain-containing protein [Myxococcales bacterium]|nr:adenylate/guanylate cyclase domain-containing protein [Myxococcales bacterium]
MPTVEFDREKTVEVDDPDLTLLEIAREAGIPHASACGGNGRCSTCRVMILEHPENFDPRNAVETRLARAKGFDDNIRLACQTTITGDVKLRRLVIDEEDLQLAQDGTPQTTGKDRQLAILFSDIRNFTPFAESHLPYDVIHILGRYFRKVGEPVIRHGGYIDKYMGDGIMAIFGLERASAAEACLDAVAAGLGMQDSLLELNEYISKQFDTTFRMGIGVHVGSVIIGEMGHPQKMQFTAIGDTVNIASRIESATKELGVGLLVSAEVRALLGEAARYGLSQRVNLKGKSGEHLLSEVVGLNVLPPPPPPAASGPAGSGPVPGASLA